MYTRSRQSNQGFPNAGQQQQRQQGTPNAQGNFSNQQGQNQNPFSQQGNYQTSQSTPASQQGNYKPANIQQFKGQQQQQQNPNQQQQNQARMQPQQAKPTTQQLQQQQLQQQLKLQQQQPAAVGTPQTQRLKPILKQSPATPASTPTASPQVNMNQSPLNTTAQAPAAQANNASEIKLPEGENVEGMDVQEQPRWRRKTPGLKVNRKLKRLRMNQRLRRTLQPKNAIMVLNEMKTGVQFTFPETQASMTNSLFLVHAEIDGKTYVGQGLSKPLARQNAAENALKCLLLEKMTAASLKARIDAESDGVQILKPDNQADSSSQNEENSEGGEKMETNSEEPDEIPWSSLASFALYKLFLEWQNQGTVVPVPRPGVLPGKVNKRETKPIIQKELPANATTVHPVMLLNQMRPGLAYVEVARVGNPPNTMFTLGVEIDGVEYTGTAKNKKDAKKITAKAALQALFGLTYPEEAKVDHAEDISMS